MNYAGDVFVLGDKVVHLAAPWWLDHHQRTGTVVQINLQGTSWYAVAGTTYRKEAIKLKVQWDLVPCGRMNQTRTSWVLAETCRKVTAAPEPMCLTKDGLLPLWELPEAKALVAATEGEQISTALWEALQPFMEPTIPPAMRPEDV